MRNKITTLLLVALVGLLTLTGCLSENTNTGNSSETGDISGTGDGPHVHEPMYEDKYDNTDETNHYYTCKTCGESVTEKHVSKFFYNINGHYYSCDCHWKDGELTEHTLENGKCPACGYEEDGDHEHDYSKYSNENSTYHLKLCECGAKQKENHELAWESDSWSHIQKCVCSYITEQESHKRDTNGKCTVCGYQSHVCTYPDKPNRYDDEFHYYDCLDENCKDGYGNSHEIDHDVYYVEGNNHYHACECGYREGTEGHTYDNGVFLSNCVCGSKPPESYDLEYELHGDSYTLVGMGSCKDKYIVVPKRHNGKPVTAVSSSAFEGNTAIVYVILHEDIRSIGSSAFAGCTSLKAVNIPECITVIKDNTFASCTSLVGVNLPDSLKSIEMFAFTGCKSFKGFRSDMTKNEVTTDVFTNLESIGDNAFTGCKSLEGKLSFYVCDYIGNEAFSGCTSIKGVELWRVTTLGGNAFHGCTSLETVVLEPEAMAMNDEWGFDIGTFSGCTALKRITVTGLFEEWIDFFANSIVEEEMGLSWYKDTPNFTVEFTEMNREGEWEVSERKKIADIYDFINENYWQ